MNYHVRSIRVNLFIRKLKSGLIKKTSVTILQKLFENSSPSNELVFGATGHWLFSKIQLNSICNPIEVRISLVVSSIARYGSDFRQVKILSKNKSFQA